MNNAELNGHWDFSDGPVWVPDFAGVAIEQTTVQRQGRIMSKNTHGLVAAHVEKALRAVIAELDYDTHKDIECGEEDGEDTYPDWAEAFMDAYHVAWASDQA